jgi:hypothetical protein
MAPAAELGPLDAQIRPQLAVRGVVQVYPGPQSRTSPARLPPALARSLTVLPGGVV